MGEKEAKNGLIVERDGRQYPRAVAGELVALRKHKDIGVLCRISKIHRTDLGHLLVYVSGG
jgi:hypothetical protein